MGSQTHIGQTDNSGRNSESTFLNWEASPTLQRLQSRFASVLGLPQDPETAGSLFEHLQVVHYKKGTFYGPHFDARGLHDKPDMRLATLLIYLQPAARGGATEFFRANGDRGLKFEREMRPGSAVLFYSALPDGNIDERSLHAGAPVEDGEKWVANLWVWEPTADIAKGIMPPGVAAATSSASKRADDGRAAAQSPSLLGEPSFVLAVVVCVCLVVAGWRFLRPRRGTRSLRKPPEALSKAAAKKGNKQKR